MERNKSIRNGFSFYFGAIAFLFLYLVNINCTYSQAVNLGEKNNLWHNIQRTQRYHPDGEDFVIVNGDKRFNRALYGTHTGFRVETGDLPEFALYMPGMGGNLRFGLIHSDTSKWLIHADKIETRYRPGSMLYEIHDTLLGDGKINLVILAMSDAEGVILKFTTSNLPPDCKLFWAYGGATGKRFPRDGDIGADPESVFYLNPDYCKDNEYVITNNVFNLYYGSGRSQSEDELYENNFQLSPEEKEALRLKNKKKLCGLVPPGASAIVCDAENQKTPLSVLNSIRSDVSLVAGEMNFNTENEFYVAVWNPDTRDNISYTELPALFEQAEAARQKLAGRIKINTPDAYINTIGGALSIAADAIWDPPSYLHGAVAWRMRLPGWRGAYAADWLGWHDRAQMHFNAYLKSQYLSPDSGPSVPDPKTNLARQQEKVGNSLYTRGYISRNPDQISKPHHYDMNLVFFDQLLWHLKWTGDTVYAREIWPALQRDLAWEKRCFDGNNDGLYDAYACIWASDALQYSGGGVTHSSAYNYRANLVAAEIANIIGENPEPYLMEAEKIKHAIDSLLWIPENGWYAEYKDLLGLKQVHPAAALWTVYHAIDAGLADAFQSYQALKYIDYEIPYIPVVADNMTKGNYNILATTNWMPYTWSINNVALAENLNTSLAYWQGNNKEVAFKLWKSAILESMYMGSSPGNFEQLSFYDAFRGELYRDFADPIGVAARTVIEGLFGIVPDALQNELMIHPGFPDDWQFASLTTPDIQFDYKKQGNTDIYKINGTLPKGMNLKLRLNAKSEEISGVLVNHKKAAWKILPESVSMPVIEIEAENTDTYTIEIVWKGSSPEHIKLPDIYAVNEEVRIDFDKSKALDIYDPQKILKKIEVNSNGIDAVLDEYTGNKTFFVKLKQGALEWWEPVSFKLKNPVEIVSDNLQKKDVLEFQIRNNTSREQKVKYVINPGLVDYKGKVTLNPGDTSGRLTILAINLIPGSNVIQVECYGKNFEEKIINWNVDSKENIICSTVDLSQYFNDRITNIFTSQYLAPRSPYPTLQLPLQGIGDWCSYNATANIDDSGLRKLAGNKNMVKIPQGISFATPGGQEKANIVFTSLWDNYPDSVTISLTGKASHAYLLMAGSTNPMQSRFVNAKISVMYEDGTSEQLELKNPENWWPIEQDYYVDGYAFAIDAPRPLRLYLKTGVTTLSTYNVLDRNRTKKIDGGAATLLDIPLNPSKKLKNLQLNTTANDVVVGLMAVTLVKTKTVK